MVKRTQKNKTLRTILIITGVVVAVLIIIFLIGLEVSLKGPSSGYVQRFQADMVAIDATNAKDKLNSGISSLALASHGFNQITTSYADGCYATNDDSFSDWHKVCFGRAVAYFSSNNNAGQTKNQLSGILTSASWKNVIISGDTFSCYGYPLSTITSYNLGFTATYQIEDASSPCESPIPEKTSVLVPVSDQKNVMFSSLTHTTNLANTLASAKAAGAKSVIAIAVETQYYNQPLGFFLFR